MITKENLAGLLRHFEFSEKNNIFKKNYPQGASIEVNFNTQTIEYSPRDRSFKEGCFPTKENPSNGFVIHRDNTLNFVQKESFVCLVCVHLLLKKKYEPKHIVLEPAFPMGHVNKPSYGDILVFDKEYKPLILIENKTYGTEFSREWNKMKKDGGQLFSYLGGMSQTTGYSENLALFAADFEDKLIPKCHIISLNDSEKRIKELENPKTYSNAKDKIFEVWSETYAQSFETKGLFEDDVEPYSVGKLKYTINDLSALSHAEIQPIYHEFATILRNHAITDFEHSFYTLIDLFLCKIEDERSNPNDLQFYYRGIKRDTPKEYCARLLELYQLGKRHLFDVEVVNKKESDIRQIFVDKGRTMNGLYDGIKDLFEEIKFYNIKKFNFIDVENRDDFELNFQILIEITSLIQDIRLSDSETNHFFGDLFEGLLSKHVHQTEGQFFTPLPIVNFIVKSLPQFPNSDNIKVLDYACGAGHFLTEFIKLYPKAKSYGIEKNQPLSQVAKIATIINGTEDSHIVFKDALSVFNTRDVRYKGFDNDDFDCIIANPPYSVTGFLNTLEEKDRQQYTLTRHVGEKSYETNKNIECFFIERANHFLRPNGLIGVVLPAAFLTNRNIYIKTRDNLFSNFNIHAIVNLNSRTFGSTGTNTIILFAQKISKNATGLLDSFIDKKECESYTDRMAIDLYIEKQGYDKDEYVAFMQDNIIGENLNTHEIFVEYRKKFKRITIKKETQKKWFKKSSLYRTEIKEKSKEGTKLFEEFLNTKEYRVREELEYEKQFVFYAKQIEYDKLKTFIQIYDNDVMVLQSPPEKINRKSNKAQIIKFLGYDWSSRRNNEGIKYLTNKNAENLSENLEERIIKDKEDAEIIAAINSIKFIETPLYNPNDAWDCSKFAFAIRKHLYSKCRKSTFQTDMDIEEYLKKDFDGEMSDLLTHTKLHDMIDFRRNSFDKSMQINGVKRFEIESKYPLYKLGGEEGLCDIRIGGTPSRKNMAYFKGNNLWVSIAEMNGQVITDTKEKITDKAVRDSNVKLVPKGTTLLSFKLSIGKTAIAGADLYTNEAIAALVPKDKSVVTDEYLFALFNGKMIDLEKVGSKAFGKSLNVPYLEEEIKIPLPPPSIQQKIVKECNKINKIYNTRQMSIEEYIKNIAKIFNRFEVIKINSSKQTPNV